MHPDVWKSLSAEEREWMIEGLIVLLHLGGYPHGSTNREVRDAQFQALMRSDYIASIDENQKIFRAGFNAGIPLAWSYMPHAASVRVAGNDTNSPMEQFEDPRTLRRVLRKTLKYGYAIKRGTLPKHLRIFCGGQGVSNFRPVTAAAIYHRFGGAGADVWDMSCGYGGRLLGAIRSGVRTYVGTDPCEATCQGLQQLARDFAPPTTRVELHKLGSEVFQPPRGSLDLCFTSPPYFNLEEYSYEPTQSGVKFPTKDAWTEGFLKQTLANCEHGLKKGGHCVVNIADVKTFSGLVNATIDIARKVGFEVLEPWALLKKKGKRPKSKV